MFGGKLFAGSVLPARAAPAGGTLNRSQPCLLVTISMFVFDSLCLTLTVSMFVGAQRSSEGVST